MRPNPICAKPRSAASRCRDTPPARLAHLSLWLAGAFLVAATLGSAACGDSSSSPAVIGPGPDSVVGLTVTPAHSTLSPGEQVTLVATRLTRNGGAEPATSVQWTTSDSAVAVVTSAGVVIALAAGDAQIEAKENALETTVAVTVGPAEAAREGHFVSPTGSPTAAGTRLDPWDLATALASNGAVEPGDTIWLRSGNYRGCFTSRLEGTADHPVVVRGLPGEAPVIDGAGCEHAPLTVFGAHAWYWGFEVRNSAPLAGGGNNIDLFGDDLRAINLVVRDAANSGFGFWSQGAGGEIYGCLIFNNGTKNNLDHGIYLQNAVGVKRLADNMIFNQWGFGIHAYGSESASLRGFLIEGNTIFNSGMIGTGGSAPNILVGGGVPAADVTVRDNNAYHAEGARTNVRLGYEANNQDIDVEHNRFVGGVPVAAFLGWSSALVAGNELVGTGELVSIDGNRDGYQWSANRQYPPDATGAWWSLDGRPLPYGLWRQATGFADGEVQGPSQPPDAEVIIRPNQYEPGRANITVFNWPGAAAIQLDLTGVVAVGQPFEIRDVQAYYDPPLIAGVYAGGVVTVPVRPATPILPLGRPASAPPVTAPRFVAYLLRSGAALGSPS